MASNPHGYDAPIVGAGHAGAQTAIALRQRKFGNLLNRARHRAAAAARSTRSAATTDCWWSFARSGRVAGAHVQAVRG